MEIILSLILGAIAGGAGAWYWKRKPTKPPAPGVTIQGGGPGNTPPPPSNGGDE